MEFRLVQDIVKNIIGAIEQSAIASVRSLKLHTFSSKVTNFPKTQEIKGTVVVGNQKSVEKQLQQVNKQISVVSALIRAIKLPTRMEVSNFPKPEKYPEPPKSVMVSNFPPPLQLKEIRISNQPTQELQDIKEQVGKVEKALGKLKLDPSITVQAPKPERVIVPPAQVTLHEKEIDYEKLADLLSERIPNIDYQKFSDVIGKKLADGFVSFGGGSRRAFPEQIKIQGVPPTDSTQNNGSIALSNADETVASTKTLTEVIKGKTYQSTISYNAAGDFLSLSEAVEV